MQKPAPDTDALGALPVYIQIAELIAREISAGHWAPGDRLPTEREMAKQYDVAVGTLRKSLSELTHQGLLERRQGSGNYVKKTENSASIYAFFRLELLAGGGLPTAEMISFDTLKKPPDLPSFGSSGMAYRFRRLRRLNDTPAALEEIWLDGDAADRIDASLVSQSLYHFYKEELGLWITRAEDWVSVAPTPSWHHDEFPIPPGTLTGFVERFGWSQAGAKVEYSRNWFDTTKVRYVARLK